MKLKLFAIFFISSFLFAQSTNDILKRIQNKFNSLNNFSASFVQTTYGAQSVSSGKMSGTFIYKRKNKFVVEFKNRTIVSNGETIWNDDKRFKRVVISNLADDPTTFSLERFIFNYPPLCKIKLINENNGGRPGEDLIEMVPKDQDMEFKSVKIWTASDGLISKLEVIDLGDVRYAFQFTDYKLNLDIPDSKFSYNPPKGIQIIDLR